MPSRPHVWSTYVLRSTFLLFLHLGSGGILENGMHTLIFVDPHLLLYLFIPPLLFLSGLEMNIRVFKYIKWQILTCAFFGTSLSICLTAVVSKYLFFWYVLAPNAEKVTSLQGLLKTSPLAT